MSLEMKVPAQGCHSDQFSFDHPHISPVLQDSLVFVSLYPDHIE